MPVRIEMPSYQIKGNMYHLVHQKVEHVLNEKTNFIPLTDVNVSSIATGKRWDVPFLAINKDQILSLHE